jgi:hypothetical protein
MPRSMASAYGAVDRLELEPAGKKKAEMLTG